MSGLTTPDSEMLTPLSQAPVPTVTNQLNSGSMGQSGAPASLLAAIGGAMARSENGIDHPPAPERDLNAPARFSQLLALGMSPEEAALMTETGGA